MGNYIAGPSVLRLTGRVSAVIPGEAFAHDFSRTGPEGEHGPAREAAMIAAGAMTAAAADPAAAVAPEAAPAGTQIERAPARSDDPLQQDKE